MNTAKISVLSSWCVIQNHGTCIDFGCIIFNCRRQKHNEIV